ncbi:hypothetical protein CF392_04850 [Tamilnaduibacter salinus]|uniref:Uncharacterized protein n=1 Tax=Tamilnaduibacter salinus TaxID=1484056 RepID=A0A2A2I479_9GAMM|nr:hypothetical protein [Tamilnaduibacter salinus]PAV26539.1 hypothetical protein CF392_04850 [Tamilnaduibacter salinus]
MTNDRTLWLLRKGLILLPVLLVLALARCTSEPADEDSNMVSAADDEPPAKEQSEEARRFTANDIKAAMRKHIQKRTEHGNPGVFEITDPRTSQTLALQFQTIHDPVRTMGGGHYFACTNFAAVGNPYKTYDLDFWLQVHDGELVVYEENVHKLPVHEGGEWRQQPRYNFVNDRINLLR